MNDTICKNCFKDGKTSTTVQAYTGAWVRFLNQLERSRAVLSGIK